MPRKSAFDELRLNRILIEQYLVISRTQGLMCGMSPRALDLRVAWSGPWQRLLPGVYLTVTGTVTQEQREMAALLYAGPQSLITGLAAVRRHRLRPPGPDVVDLLIPWTQRWQSTGYVRVHRTRWRVDVHGEGAVPAGPAVALRERDGRRTGPGGSLELSR